MERNQEGEQLKLLDPASLPGSPSFPVRWMFSVYGLAAGLCIGLCFAAWLELRDKSIRDEGDVLAALELPMLVSLPWSKAKDKDTDDAKQMLTFRGPLTLSIEKKKEISR
jgi:capsular polysaccharide biosynthesis protein